MAAKPDEMIGKVFGGLEVIAFAGSVQVQKEKGRAWLCRCLMCGTGEKIVTTALLRSGNNVSCGCRLKHGWSKTKPYKTIRGAISRCHNQNHPSYKDYGGRGITVCDEWRNNLVAFCEYLGFPPDDRKWTLERLDGSRGYEPGNVAWALPATQVRNRRKQANNTSTITGVHWTFKDFNTYAVAQWQSGIGPQSKFFSVKKYGLLPAFALACIEREKMIEELNKQGAGYSASHGK